MKTIFGLFLFFFACLTARAADTDQRIEVVLNGGLMASVRNTQVEGRPIAACHFVSLQYLDGTVVQVTEAYSFRKGAKLYLPLSMVDQPCDRSKVAEWFEVESELLRHPGGDESFKLQAARIKARQGEEVARAIPPPQLPPPTPASPPPNRVVPPAPKPVEAAKVPPASVPPPVVEKSATEKKIDFQALQRNGFGQLPSASEEGFSITQQVVEEPQPVLKPGQVYAPKPKSSSRILLGISTLGLITLFVLGFLAREYVLTGRPQLQAAAGAPKTQVIPAPQGGAYPIAPRLAAAAAKNGVSTETQALFEEVRADLRNKIFLIPDVGMSRNRVMVKVKGEPSSYLLKIFLWRRKIEADWVRLPPATGWRYVYFLKNPPLS